jgi:hypothetical protein
MNPLELDELELTPLMEVKTTQRKPGWILVAGIVCVLIWVALYYFWIR